VSVHPELAEAIGAYRRGDLVRARALAERRAAAQGPNPQIDHLLGLILCRSGDARMGAEHLRRAADYEPTNPSHRLMLSRALIDCGEPAEALKLSKPLPADGQAIPLLWHARAEAADAAGDYDSSIEAWQAFARIRQTDWRAWNNLGEALARARRWNEAATALDQAVQLNPVNVEIRRKLAGALASGGLLEESVAEFREVMQLDRRDASTAIALAQALAALGRRDEALEVLDDAAERGADAAELEILRARNLLALWRYDEAEELFRGMLNRAPSDGVAVHELGLILERSNRLDELADLIRRAEQNGVDESALTYLRAALAFREKLPREALKILNERPSVAEPAHMRRLKARAADALGDSDAAFAAAAASNRLVDSYDEWRSAGAEFRRQLRELAAVVEPEWGRRINLLHNDKRRAPVFLVGFPRSGTTLLDTFLMGHGDMAVLEEKRLVAEAERVVGKIADLPEASPEMLVRARDAYLAELFKYVDPDFSGVIVDKLPFNMLGAPLIHAIFPDAKFIFAQRHPCDAVLSGFMQSFTPNEAMASFLDIGDAADLYDATMQVWTRSCAALPLSFHTIVYEELVENVEGVLRPLIEFLEVPWNRDLLDHRSTAKGRGAIITPSYDQVIQPITRSASGRWRRYEKQLEPVLPVLLPWAERLGY
jgi:tetratricopeptide (TPR) repeat protein